MTGTRYAIRVNAPVVRADRLIARTGGVLDFDEAQAVLVNWIRAINVGDAHESKRVIEAVVETAKSLAGEASFRRTFGRPSGAPVPAGRTMLHLCWVSPTP